MPVRTETAALHSDCLAAGLVPPGRLSLFGLTDAQEQLLRRLLEQALAEGRPVPEEALSGVQPAPLPPGAEW